MPRLSEMNKLAAGARSAGRDPVKNQFTKDEKGIVEHFFRSQTERKLNSDRMNSFLSLCRLLGEPLDASKWHLLEDTDIVGNLRFLVGGDTVKSDGLRSGAIWLQGSRRFADPATYLIPSAQWTSRRSEALRILGLEQEPREHLEALAHSTEAVIQPLGETEITESETLRLEEGRIVLSPASRGHLTKRKKSYAKGSCGPNRDGALKRQNRVLI